LLNLKLISPAPRNKYCNKKGKTSFPQLNLRIIEALTPSDFSTTIYDERIEDIDLHVTPDLVGITVLTSVAPRAYEIADTYRARGIQVILGGIHPSLMPEEALNHSDAVVIGEAEGIWGKVISDFREGNLQKTYNGAEHLAFEKTYPKLRPIRKPNAYSVCHTIQTTRGCPFDCEFCSVTRLWGKKYRFRPVDDVIDEMKQFASQRIIIVDDNVVGSPKYSKRLFEKMIPLKIRWAGQASLTITQDEQLLKLAKKSGCEWLFIGIESLSAENLNEMNKKINKLDVLEKDLRTIKKAGINIVGSFIFGLDHDDKSVFDNVVDFCIRNKLDAANFYALTPLPGTALFDKMDREGRILSKDWSLYDANHVVFQPKNMTPAELLEGYIKAYKRMYSFGSISKRVNTFSGSVLHMFAFNMMRMKNRSKFGQWSHSVPSSLTPNTKEQRH